MKENNQLSQLLGPQPAKILFEILSRELSEISPVKVYLFGSYAKGTNHPTSDIDIAIDAARPLSPVLWSRLEESFSESDIPAKVDVVDFHRIQPAFQDVVLKSPILIYSR